MVAYYNENNAYAAQWLRNLMKEGLIAPGIVDERSIVDVTPSYIIGFTQCHFFAGIGVWSYALRQAGWPDNEPVWTGSCPCQPFSSAGARKGNDDERHLWPVFYKLIQQCRPPAIFGEQVSSHDVIGRANAKTRRTVQTTDPTPWLESISLDLERARYAVGSLSTNAASVGAPHKRQRVYWVADSGECRPYGEHSLLPRNEPRRLQEDRLEASGSGEDGELEQPAGQRRGARAPDPGGVPEGSPAQGTLGRSAESGGTERLEHSDGAGREGWTLGCARGPERAATLRSKDGKRDRKSNSAWSFADWIFCRDGYWRPVEPCSSPLADGLAYDMGLVCAPETNPYREKGPSRQEMLRGYGNAIVGPLAIEFIKAFMSVKAGEPSIFD